jgi:hypothetical protein
LPSQPPADGPSSAPDQVEPPRPAPSYGQERLEGGCLVSVSSPLRPEDPVPFGGTVGEVLGLVVGKRRVPLAWERAHAQWEQLPVGTTTMLTLEVTPLPDGIRFARSRWAPAPDAGAPVPAGATLPKLFCQSELVIDARVRFVTDDGGFDESWTLEVRAPSRSEAGYVVDLDRNPPRGALRIRYRGPERIAKTTFYLDGSFLAGGVVQGNAYLLTELGPPPGYTAITFAHWPAQPGPGR